MGKRAAEQLEEWMSCCALLNGMKGSAEQEGLAADAMLDARSMSDLMTYSGTERRSVV